MEARRTQEEEGGGGGGGGPFVAGCLWWRGGGRSGMGGGGGRGFFRPFLLFLPPRHLFLLSFHVAHLSMSLGGRGGGAYKEGEIRRPLVGAAFSYSGKGRRRPLRHITAVYGSTERTN